MEPGREVENQNVTRIAAVEAYDYESDPRWMDFWSNINIPAHMASRSDIDRIYKLMFYQRYVDPNFMSVGLSSRHPDRAESSASTHLTTSRNSGVGDSTTQSRTSQPDRGATADVIPLRFDFETIQFTINAWVLVVSLLGILPVVSSKFANKACRLTLLGTASSSLYSLYTLYGKPRAWDIPLIHVWILSIIRTKDFMYFLYCLVFTPFKISFKVSMLPLICRALVYDTKFLRYNFSNSSLYRRYLAEGCLWVEANTTTLSVLSSNVEIAIGFLLILTLFTWLRNIVLTLMYWHLLKLMYHAPATAMYHQIVWAKITRIVMPNVFRYAPFLNAPLSVFQKWWFI